MHVAGRVKLQCDQRFLDDRLKLIWRFKVKSETTGIAYFELNLISSTNCKYKTELSPCQKICDEDSETMNEHGTSPISFS